MVGDLPPAVHTPCQPLQKLQEFLPTTNTKSETWSPVKPKTGSTPGNASKATANRNQNANMWD